MSEIQVTIQAKDGPCRAWVLTPHGAGRWPAVILYMDGFGIRPGMIQMATHLASKGYVVLLPDLYYRFGDYAPLDPREVLKGNARATIGPMMASTDNHAQPTQKGRSRCATVGFPDRKPRRSGSEVTGLRGQKLP